MFVRRAGLCCKVLVAALSICFIADYSNAQTESRWIGTSGNWGDASNWDNGVPNGFAVAIIEAGAGQVVQDVVGVTLVGLELDSTTANVVLQNTLVVEQFLNWNEGKISGSSTLEFQGVGHINGGDLETTFENFGFIEFGTDGQFTRLQSPAGGAWINRSGSFVDALHGVLFGSFGNAGPGTIDIEPNSTFRVSGGSLQTVWAYTNDGVTELNNAFAFFLDDYVQSQDAKLLMNAGGADFFQVSDLSGLVSGTGSILNLNGPFEVEFEPGGSQIGVVSSGGSISMTPNTVSNFQIGPNLTSDVLSNAGGPLQLDGILNIEALPGATPGTYTLFSYNNASMLQVDLIQLGSVPAGFNGFLFHNPQMQSVNLIVETIDPVILGDINRDGSVNLLDVNPFIELLSNGEFQVEADINGDGVVNLLDISGFVALLGGG